MFDLKRHHRYILRLNKIYFYLAKTSQFTLNHNKSYKSPDSWKILNLPYLLKKHVPQGGDFSIPVGGDFSIPVGGDLDLDFDEMRASISVIIKIGNKINDTTERLAGEVANAVLTE